MFYSFYQASYEISQLILLRALALIYLTAFINAWNQFPVLLGEHGLQPARRFLDRLSFRRAPTLFHWHYSDRMLKTVAATGATLSLINVSGLPDAGPYWVSMITWSLCWFLYLSIVNAGQTFYGLGWESMLLEFGFYAILLGPARLEAPAAVFWIIRWMLFRVEFGAGMIKMRGDACWKNLTCLKYHHETQPMPNPLSWYFHHLPEWWHKIETLFNHLVQLGIIWLIFAPQPVASVAALLIILSQCYLLLSGNYSWLNLLTVVLAFSAIGDGFYQTWLGVTPVPAQPQPAIFQGFILLLLVLVIILSYRPAKNLFSSRQMMNFSFNPLHLVNTYGAFGSVTRTRYEIIIEGTRAEHPDEKADWKAYGFKGKPGDPERRPPQVAPYHLRLDWQMWFAALRPRRRPAWLMQLIRKLLKNDPQATGLLLRNPFPGNPPQYIRARLFEYRFTSPERYKETGEWWMRSFRETYLPPTALEDIRAKRI